MKHGKKPTRAQMARIGKAGLAPENWLVVKNCPDGAMVVLHKHTDRVRVIPASITTKDREGEKMDKLISVKGRVVADAVLGKTLEGSYIATFRIAVDHDFGDYKADSADIVIQGALAERVGEKIKAGNLVMVDGYLRSRPYTDKDGKPRAATEVMAENIYRSEPGVD